MSMLAVFLGGGLGALCRYGLSLWMQGEGVFLLFVNGLGSFLGGLASGYLYERGWVSAFVLIGFLGGLTTFSAFSLTMVRMIHTQPWVESLFYGVVFIFVPIFLCYVGMALGLLLTR